MKVKNIIWAVVAMMVLASGCHTFKPAVPKPMTFQCSLPKAEFMKKAKELLERNRFTVDVYDEEKGEIEADRVPSYNGIGENLIVRGPYVFNVVYNNGTVTVVVQTVHDRDGKPYAVESHDEGSDIGERRNFMPVIEGLKAACK